MTEIVASEFCGKPSKRKNNFVVQHDGSVVKLKNGRRHDYSFGHFFNEVFFPEGYPDSVSQDYFSYQVYDTIQAFCSSVNGTIATQSIMRGLGVGEEATTALAATLTWVLKDGVGMIGRIVFAWAQGTDLDCDLKRWRLRADLLNDVAMFLDVISAHFGHYFVIIVCCSALLKAIVGIAGLGTRPAIIQHQARRNNIGDVAAKDSSQETLVNLAALTKLDFFLALAFIHIVANYYAVRSLSLETFNPARFYIAAHSFFSSGYNIVPSVVSVNRQEPIIFSRTLHWKIEIGSRIPRRDFSLRDLQFIRDVYAGNSFSIWVDTKAGRISVFLSQLAADEDILKAAFEAELVAHRLVLLRQPLCSEEEIQTLLRQVRLDAPNLEKAFSKLASSDGWDLSRNYMAPKEWRVNWKITDHDAKILTL